MTRTAILSRIRDGRREIGRATDHVLPRGASVVGSHALADFVRHLEAHGVCVERCATDADIPATILRYLEAARVPLRIRMGTDAFLAALPWRDTPRLTRLEGAAVADDLAAVSVAVAGIAETGTLVLASGPDNPCTLAFLPDVHFVVIKSATVVGSLEAALAGVSERRGTHPWPRAVNLISGASRTGDIGGQLVMGAHGPRQLVVMIV